MCECKLVERGGSARECVCVGEGGRWKEGGEGEYKREVGREGGEKEVGCVVREVGR